MIAHVRRYFVDVWQRGAEEWNRFWFSPADPATLCWIRVLAGSMLLYTHVVWSVDLLGMFGPNGALSLEFSQAFQAPGRMGWSHLNGLEQPLGLWVVHGLGLVVLLAFVLGLFSRVTSVLAFLMTVSYAHRGAGALYGLDQINAMLALYLMVGPSGACYSVDAWWRARQGRGEAVPSVSANIAVRLMQLHMCLIYLFAGLGKLLGETWWDGTALWGAFANYEYQTIDMTWLAHFEYIVNLLTHVTVVWEVTYPVAIWNRWTRPLYLALAVPLHLGIGMCMGMMTFGLVMIYGNWSFVSPRMTRQVVAWLRGCCGGGHAEKNLPFRERIPHRARERVA